jgi:hypothetical protein
VVYASSTSALATSSTLNWDNTNTRFGIGVTPSAWNSALRVVQAKTASISSNGGTSIFAANVFYDSAYATKYIDTASAGAILHNAASAGGWQFFVGPSGTSGAAATLTQAMTLDVSGNLMVGTTSAAGVLTVVGANSSDGPTAKYIANIRNSGAQTSGVGAGIAFTQTMSSFNATLATIQGIKENGTSDNYASALSFYTRANGADLTERARIDSSGNLGLGVTPSAWSGYTAFQVKDAALASSGSADVNLTANSFYGSLGWTYKQTAASARYALDSQHRWFTAASGTAGTNISFTQAMTLDASGYLLVGATSSAGVGTNRLQVGSSGSTAQILAKSATNHIGLYASSGTDSYMSYATGAALLIGNGPADGSTFTERARIDSSGNLLVGTSSVVDAGAQGVQIATTTNTKWVLATSSVDRAWIANTTQTSGTSYYTYFNFNGSNVGSITSTGTITVYNTTSDYRLKNVVGAVTGHGERIDALEPVEYTWKSNGLRTRGFLAHKFQEVYADSVTGTKDAVDADGKPIYQAMQAGTAEVIADLVAEIQSLRQRLSAANL